MKRKLTYKYLLFISAMIAWSWVASLLFILAYFHPNHTVLIYTNALGEAFLEFLISIFVVVGSIFFIVDEIR